MSELKKREKYPLKKIYFYLTEGCNLTCRHCWISPKLQTKANIYPSLSFDLFKSIVEQGKQLGLVEVKLTGGEPLLHPGILDILEFIREQNLRLTIETNGTLCSPELAKKIAACKGAFVSVSLDGPSAEIHEWVRGVKGSFSDALNGIGNIVQVGISPQIIMTVMRYNKDYLEDIVGLSESLGVGSVKFNIVQPSGRGKKLKEDNETLLVEELIDLGRWVEEELAPGKKIPIYFKYPPAFRALGRIFGKEGIGISSCGIQEIIGVLSDGSYALCGIGTQIPELIFGRSVSDRLEDVWYNSPLLIEIREGIPDRFEGICGKCLMKRTCIGECIAQNYFRSRNIWAPFWFCEEADKASLFPETRMRHSFT